MKKFLIFLVSIVIVVCVGLTTYYFMRNNEIISVKTKEIYCNAGDTIPLKSLGITIDKANVSKKTQFDYNAGGENVTQYIKYDEVSDSFIVSQENGGEVTLVISTTNKKYADFTISVHIGNGSVEYPYFIFSESDLMKIGSTYRLDSHYKLMNDITLTSQFKGIGFNGKTSTWDGFSGSFDGQGYSIKGLNISSSESSNVGLFSTLNASANVKNLVIDNATISGEYENVGILAGTINGNIEKVVVKNSSITNTAVNSTTGALAGYHTGSVLKLSYAENVIINLNGSEEQKLNSVKAGGLIGELNQSTIQACYTNNVKINISNVDTVKAGGLVGVFKIGTETGSIQQSYSNTICLNENFGAFVGNIVSSENFNIEKANMLRHLIGNFAVVYGVESSAAITDSKLVNESIGNFFKNETYVDRSAFFDKDSALYLIRGFASAGEAVSTNEFIYYAIDMNNLTTWDTTYVWNTSGNSLPTLRMGNIYPSAPSGEYFRRNLAQKDMGNKETFVSTFSSDVVDQNIKLLEDVDLSNGWTPVAIKNVTFDGNCKTITINLNNANNLGLGLFNVVDNSTIKNLNIIVTGVSANAVDAGALAGLITSSDEMATSSIENVKVTYQGFGVLTTTYFGGIAGRIKNTNIINCSVSDLNINLDSQIDNAGSLVAIIDSNSNISNCTINNSTIVGIISVGGIAATNSGSITSVQGNVTIISKSANVGGVVEANYSVIDNIKLTVNINVKTTTVDQYIAGVVGFNSGTVSNVEINGDKIAIEQNNANEINVGGVVAVNAGTITNIENNISTVGTYFVNANHYVAGVAVVNNGKISKVISQSNLNGNYVSGVVAKMNSSQAVVDQIVVGKFNATTRLLGQNKLVGDKYIAGVIVDFKSGNITNIQAASEIIGQANSTRSSLVALIFQYGANLTQATINSSLTGYGTKYREVWTDFASYSNKGEFGLSAVNGDIDGRFNLYLQDSHHGKMQSVVINSANAGVASAKSSLGGAFAWGKDYDDTADSSFIKTVDGFSDVSQFQNNFEFVCAKSSILGIEHKVTKTLDYAIGKVWKSNHGISLMFLDDLVEYVEPEVIGIIPEVVPGLPTTC